MNIRPFTATEEEYGALVRIERAIWPDRAVTTEMFKHGDRNREAKYYFERVLAESDGTIVAVASVAEPFWSYRPGKYNLDIAVTPQYERRGIGRALYDYLIAAIGKRESPATLLTASTREDKPQGIAFLEKRGYRQTMRWPRSEIDLSTFDPARFQSKVDQVAADGIEIKSLAELKLTDPDWQRKVYDLDWAGTVDEPQPDAPTQMPFDQYVKRVFEHPEHMPEGFFIAVDDGEYVALSELERNPEGNEELGTGFTCVLRSHRRRGVATALKVHALVYAQSLGTKRVRTGNEENNPMYGINLQLGFVPAPGWLAYERAL